jgi:hypothetical protein
VKRQVGITHGYFDAWIYGFLENKKFNIEETVAKLHRRFAMEVNELATIHVTDYMRNCLRSGSHHFLGADKLGRSVFLINIKRDLPDPKHAEERRHLFDLFMSYGSRLRKDGRHCRMVVIFNQEGADSKKNYDLSALLACATHVAKFYPGALDKTYFCKMSRTLTVLAKAVLKAFPSAVTERLEILSEADLRQGALRKVIDEDVLPVALGGRNDCDHAERWRANAEDIEDYFRNVQRAICTRGMRVKEYELECLGVSAYSVDPSDDRTEQLSLLSPPRCYSCDLNPGLSQDSSHEEVPSAVTSPLSVSRPPSVMVVPAAPPQGSAGVCAQSGQTDTSSSVPLDCFALHRSAEKADPVVQQCDGKADDLDDLERSPSWFSAVSPLSDALALWFLDELLYWRENIEEAEREERKRICEDFAAALAEAHTDATCGACAVMSRKWYHEALHGATPLLLLLALLLNAIVLLSTHE